MPSAATSRKLAGTEHALRFIDDVAPFNVVAVLLIEGDLPTGKLRSALDEVQRRHPLLHARILSEGNAYSFHFGEVGPVPLEVREAPPAGEWLAAAEAELHRRFNLASGPLMRCSYLSAPSGGYLLLTLHHSIVDGASGLYLVNELLALCAAGAPVHAAAASHANSPAAADLYPDQYTGKGLARGLAAFMARQVADEAKFRWRSRGVRKAPIAAAGRCRLLPVHIPARLTSALLQVSRRERITLNAILSAGLMSAVQRRLYPSPRVPLRHIIFTDLRPHLRRSVPASELGCYISMFRFTAIVEQNGSFWTLARDIQEKTLRAARSGERYLAHAMSPKMMEAISNLRAFRMAATALSYTGALEMPASHGTFTVTGLHAFTTNFSLGPEYSALVHLFRGELWCDILYLDCDMDPAGARRIADEMQAILESVAC